MNRDKSHKLNYNSLNQEFTRSYSLKHNPLSTNSQMAIMYPMIMTVNNHQQIRRKIIQYKYKKINQFQMINSQIIQQGLKKIKNKFDWMVLNHLRFMKMLTVNQQGMRQKLKIRTFQTSNQKTKYFFK